MNIVVQAADDICLCADSVQTYTDDQLDGLWQYGVRALGCYAVLTTPQTLARYLAKGFKVFWLTTSRAPGWAPSAATGQADAATVLAHLQMLNIPKGATVFDDFETPSATSSSPDKIAHVDACASLLVAAGFEAGVYIGEGCALTSAEWHARPQVTAYGESCSDVRDSAGTPVRTPRGWRWQQAYLPNRSVAGAIVDLGMLRNDFRGDVVRCVAAAA